MADDSVELHEHPDYTAQKFDWQTWKDLYEGKHAVLVQSQYLWKHELEEHPTDGARLRGLREKRSRYLNLTEPVLSVWISMLFKQEPEVDESVKKLFGDAYDDVDGKGNSFLAFLKGPVCLSYFRDGKAVVFADAPGFEKPKAERTKADEEGHRAYFECLPALCVKDWQESNDQGNTLELLRYEYTEVSKRTSLTDKPKELLYSKVLAVTNGVFTVTKYVKREKDSRWILAPAKAGETNPQVTDLTELPVTIAAGESWVRDVAEIQLQLFNHMSSWNNQLNYQAFQRHVFAGTIDSDQKKAWSEFSAIVVNPGTEVTTIPPADTTPMLSAIQQDIEWLFKVAFNRTQSLASNTKAVAGAETIRELKEEMFSLVETSIPDIENLANEMIRQYALYKGEENFEGKVTFSRDIDIEDVAQQLEIAIFLKPYLDQVPEWKKPVLKKFLSRQNLSEDDEAEASKGIDAMKDVDPLQALLPQPAPGLTKFGQAKEPASANQPPRGVDGGRGGPPRPAAPAVPRT